MLDWFAGKELAYPWRRSASDPYRVLVSEVMLQQTQAVRVANVFERFFERFPDVASLGAATPGEVVRAWSGLGYNRRALALWRCARRILVEHGGAVPDDPEGLMGLPGIGPYTAAAVASIAYGQPVPTVDTNVRRVVARAVLGAEPREVAPRVLLGAARAWMPLRQPGTWNQALMDLGREVCRPVPRCPSCPLAGRCVFRRSGRAPAPPRASQGRYEGSFRKLRGTVVEVLRAGRPVTIGRLCRATGESPDRVAAAVRALAADGLVRAGRAALAGRPKGQARLAD
ncbi:MAG: A/G-specific adenine glycosylase [Actinobacteria bacterium]|nr:MAG: A/G-specific adenine glycosylase [Actinomycetota bacterium]